MLPDLSALALSCPEIGAGDSDEDDSEEGDLLTKLLRAQGKKRLAALKEEAEQSEKRKKSRKQPSALVSPPPIAPAPEERTERLGDGQGDGKGFRQKKSALLKPPLWREENMLDFSFENPLDGRFKDIPVVKELIENYPSMVRRVDTSYCHYGYDYRKRTVFVTSLINFKPTRPCPELPCSWIRSGLTEHPSSVQTCAKDQKNSIPPALIDLLINSWRERHAGKATAFLLVDVFSGFGSIERRVREKKRLREWEDVRVYSNDVVQRDPTDVILDMRKNSLWTVGSLLTFAVNMRFPLEDDEERSKRIDHPQGLIGWLTEQKIAVLFHCSTPCITYSTNGLGYHRFADTLEPKTNTARDHDLMNESLIQYFKKTVLSPRDISRTCTPPPTVRK